MPATPSIPTRQKHNTHWWFFLWGFLAGLLAAVLCAAVVLGIFFLRARAEKAAAANVTPDAYVQLSVAVDGCGVMRSEVSGSTAVDALTWVIEDADGFAVLERGADNEYNYRYFAAGHYIVHLKAWYGGRYHTISNEIEIDC